MGPVGASRAVGASSGGLRSGGLGWAAGCGACRPAAASGLARRPLGKIERTLRRKPCLGGGGNNRKIKSSGTKGAVSNAAMSGKGSNAMWRGSPRPFSLRRVASDGWMSGFACLRAALRPDVGALAGRVDRRGVGRGHEAAVLGAYFGNVSVRVLVMFGIIFWHLF